MYAKSNNSYQLALVLNLDFKFVDVLVKAAQVGYGKLSVPSRHEL